MVATTIKKLLNLLVLSSLSTSKISMNLNARVLIDQGILIQIMNYGALMMVDMVTINVS
jgi:hypothetical protein